jgi:very-short-patch-repair endonuclease
MKAPSSLEGREVKRPPDVSGIAGSNSDLKPVGGGGLSIETLRHRAREMRNNPTEPERRLWNALKSSQLQGAKFRRQQLIGSRIVDFYCSAARLVVEVDGHTHDADSDHRKDAWLLHKHGIHTVRFTNDDVMRNLDGVLLRLAEALDRLKPPPDPLLGKEGESSL